MKSLIKKLKKSNLAYIIRNNLNYRANPFSLEKIKCASVSDAFLWRTDSGYSTIFKYTDIIKLFFKIEGSYVEIVFYSKDNKLIKKLNINGMNYSNQLLINSELLNGLNDYGTFYVYHFHSKHMRLNKLYFAMKKPQ